MWVIRLKGLRGDSHSAINYKQGISISCKPAIYEWKLKCIQTSFNDKIGVVADIDFINKSSWINDPKFIDSIFWWRHTKQIWHHHMRYNTNGGMWKSNDIIKLRLDAYLWTIQWFKSQIQFSGFAEQPFLLSGFCRAR